MERFEEWRCGFYESSVLFVLQQAIHPSQVDIIQSTFVPTEKGLTLKIMLTTSYLSSYFILEILRAAKIVAMMEASHKDRKGAFGLDDDKGGKEMIDAPMLKQVCTY